MIEIKEKLTDEPTFSLVASCVNKGPSNEQADPTVGPGHTETH